MDQHTHDEIMNWMSDQENMKKLSMVESIKISLAMAEYTEKIAPIILKHMAAEEKSTFLFKL